jgi:hypothetical protein
MGQIVEVDAAQYAALLDFHDARVSELLTSNNEMLERYRAEKRRADAAEAALLALARVAGELARIKLNAT